MVRGAIHHRAAKFPEWQRSENSSTDGSPPGWKSEVVQVCPVNHFHPADRHEIFENPECFPFISTGPICSHWLFYIYINHQHFVRWDTQNILQDSIYMYRFYSILWKWAWWANEPWAFKDKSFIDFNCHLKTRTLTLRDFLGRHETHFLAKKQILCFF